MKTRLAMLGLAGFLVVAGCGKNNAPVTSTTPDANAPAGSANSGSAPASGNAMTAQNGPAMQGGPANGGAMMQQAPPAPPPPITVPAGTSIPVILSQGLSSRTNTPGQEFEGSVAAPVMVNGEEAIPKGAHVEGSVEDAQKQGMFKGQATLAVKLNKITVGGKPYLIATNTYVETEKGKGKRTAVVTGGGAALGALIGGLAGGGKGALIGGAAGAGGGAAVSGGTGGKNVSLPAESRVVFKLTESVTIDRN